MCVLLDKTHLKKKKMIKSLDWINIWGNKYIFLKSCYRCCSTYKYIIKGHLGHGGCARQEGVTIAAHQHSVGRDAETQIFLSWGKCEHKRNSWMDLDATRTAKTKKEKLDLRFSAASRCSSGGSWRARSTAGTVPCSERSPEPPWMLARSPSVRSAADSWTHLHGSRRVV